MILSSASSRSAPIQWQTIGTRIFCSIDRPILSLPGADQMRRVESRLRERSGFGDQDIIRWLFWQAPAMMAKDCADKRAQALHVHPRPGGQTIDPVKQPEPSAETRTRDNNRFHVAEAKRDLVRGNRNFVVSWFVCHSAICPTSASSTKTRFRTDR